MVATKVNLAVAKWRTDMPYRIDTQFRLSNIIMDALKSKRSDWPADHYIRDYAFFAKVVMRLWVASYDRPRVPLVIRRSASTKETQFILAGWETDTRNKPMLTVPDEYIDHWLAH